MSMSSGSAACGAYTTPGFDAARPPCYWYRMMVKRVCSRLLLAALAMFAWTLRRFSRMVMAGRPEPRLDRVGDRLRSLLDYFLGQKKVVEDVEIPARRAPNLVTAIGSRYHLFIFWGFLIITVGHGGDPGAGPVPACRGPC